MATCATQTVVVDRTERAEKETINTIDDRITQETVFKLFFLPSCRENTSAWVSILIQSTFPSAALSSLACRLFPVSVVLYILFCL